MGDAPRAEAVTPAGGATPPQSRRASVAGALALAWAVVLVAFDLFLLVAYPFLVKVAENSYCEVDDHPGPCAGALELYGPGLVVLPVALWCLLVSVTFRRGRPWARPALVVTFLVLTVCVIRELVHLYAVEHGLPELGDVIVALVLVAWFVAAMSLAATSGRQGADAGAPARGPGP